MMSTSCSNLSQGMKLEGRERILRCPGKNRFGATNVVGYFELTDKGLVPFDATVSPSA